MTYYNGKDMARSFRTVRENTLKIAEEIPENKYDFRAAPDVRTVVKLSFAAWTKMREPKSTSFEDEQPSLTNAKPCPPMIPVAAKSSQIA